MEFQTKNIEGYRIISANYNYKSDKDLIDAIILKARDLSIKVNPHSSGGQFRNEEIRTNKLLGGLLVEHAFLNLFDRLAVKHKVPFEIIDSSFTQDGDLESMGFNQIDIDLLLNQSKLEIEVRSSFSYKTTFNRLLGFPLKNGKGAFSLIGWYSSKNKKKEIIKDLYVFGILYHKPSQMLEKAKTNCKINIVAIASKETLSDKGYDDNLKQPGAIFKVINPINSIDDVVSVLKILLNVGSK